MSSPFKILKELREKAQKVWGHRYVKWLLILWAFVASYDTALSEWIPAGWADKAPKAREVLAMTSGFLPFWGWLLILAAILVFASLEFAFRRSPTNPVAVPPAEAIRPAEGKSFLANRGRALITIGGAVFVLIAIGCGAYLFMPPNGARIVAETVAVPSAPAPKSDSQMPSPTTPNVPTKPAPKSPSAAPPTQVVASARLLYDAANNNLAVLGKEGIETISTEMLSEGILVYHGPVLIRFNFGNDIDGPFDIEINKMGVTYDMGQEQYRVITNESKYVMIEAYRSYDFLMPSSHEIIITFSKKNDKPMMPSVLPTPPVAATPSTAAPCPSSNLKNVRITGFAKGVSNTGCINQTYDNVEMKTPKGAVGIENKR